MEIITSRNERETEVVAQEFAKRLKKGDVVCLNGELGAGKTAFVHGLARGLGIDEYISSPTFTIVNEYDAPIPMYHFDVYRISDCDEMYDIGFDDYIDGSGVCVIEWSVNIKDILPRGRYEILIERDYSQGDDFRTIKIDKTDAIGEHK